MRLSSSRPRRGVMSRATAVAVAAVVLATAIGGAAIAATSSPKAETAGTGNPLRLGVQNRAIDQTVLFANNNTYALRESNLSTSGGGAIHGCRSGTGPGNNPCLQAVNLRQGQAFKFWAQNGASVGSFILGTNPNQTNPNAPFTVNGTGVVTNLNADDVDGHDAVCPENSTLSAGICFDNAFRQPAQNLQGAASACVAAGGRLATALELSSRASSLNLAPGAGEWSSDMFFTGANAMAVTVAGPGGTFGQAAINASHPYRCVYELVR
jgi:hypothetical protein